MTKLTTFRLHKEELVLKTKQLRNKWISISLMIAMLLALLPPLSVSAAATISITNLYSPNPNAPAPGNYDDSLVNKITR